MTLPLITAGMVSVQEPIPEAMVTLLALTADNES